jgi:oligopeptide/dipeptide ABC transporter ATP-binding protein
MSGFSERPAQAAMGPQIQFARESFINEIADTVAVMYAGRIVERGPVARVLRAPAHPYTAGMLASTVHGQPRERDIDAVPGSPPDLRRLPPGLQLRAADCRHAVPKPRFPEPGHMACVSSHDRGGRPTELAAQPSAEPRITALFSCPAPTRPSSHRHSFASATVSWIPAG